MLFNFDTMEMSRAKSALLLYALFKSRDAASPLNGLETWSRAESFCKAACLKSSSTAEFVTRFKEMAKIPSIKPYYLTDASKMVEMPDGSFIQSDNVRDYKLDIFEDDEIRRVIEKEYPIIVMLVRERIQREKLTWELTEEENEDENI